jgi:hypothetical protein
MNPRARISAPIAIARTSLRRKCNGSDGRATAFTLGFSTAPFVGKKNQRNGIDE